MSPPEDEALLDELGGSIDVRAAVDGLAAALGERVVLAQVFELGEQAGGVLLRTSEGLWSADRVIVCAGAQVHSLSEQLGLDIPLQIELHARASFRVREPGASLACLQDRSGAHGEVVYAAPMPDGREYAIGLGTEHEPPVDEALARLRTYVERAMPGLDPEPVSVRLCKTSILPWGADAFAVWRSGAVDVLAGANLFKFALLVGELLVDGSAELSPERQLGGTAAASAPRPLTERERQRQVQSGEQREDHRKHGCVGGNSAASVASSRKNLGTSFGVTIEVRAEGLEPPRPLGHDHLKVARMPISPRPPNGARNAATRVL